MNPQLREHLARVVAYWWRCRYEGGPPDALIYMIGHFQAFEDALTARLLAALERRDAQYSGSWPEDLPPVLVAFTSPTLIEALSKGVPRIRKKRPDYLEAMRNGTSSLNCPFSEPCIALIYGDRAEWWSENNLAAKLLDTFPRVEAS